MCALHVPLHPVPTLRADHVPCSTMSLLSLSRIHEPAAVFGVLGENAALHFPRYTTGPADALKPPCSVAGACWPQAGKQSASVAASMQALKRIKQQFTRS